MFLDMQRILSGWHGSFSWKRSPRLDPLCTWRLPELRKGSYLARMKQAPLEESLGLDIEYRAAEHVVMGLLAEEDILDE